ncbi:hypothetical protein EYF80_023181 [Liparis tanakae]|uniref:Uncharacterized protein n=1 Tax=Liparis tanakae TaxID=230148 RepID=A0A4Z2HLL9_9TELE|nr:hypothetical protein EYF80_023181 [Liparis tanakae]
MTVSPSGKCWRDAVRQRTLDEDRAAFLHGQRPPSAVFILGYFCSGGEEEARAASQQEHNTPHRKAQDPLRIPVKRHLDGCPSNFLWCALPSAVKGVEGRTKRAVLRISTCYGHTRVAAGDSRPVGDACHALIDAHVAGLKGGDGEGALVDLHARQGVAVQGTASEAPGNGCRRRTGRAQQTSSRASTLNQGGGLREERWIWS